MNDFLQGLRNSQTEKPRTPKVRKNFENTYYSGTSSRFNSYGGSGYPGTSRTPQMKRPASPGISKSPGNQINEDPNTVLLAEVLENISTQVDILIKNQEYMTTIQERTADLLQRQTDAIEIIMERLDISRNQEMDTPPARKHHCMPTHVPDYDDKESTVDELLKAEMAEQESGQAAAQKSPQDSIIIKRRRKFAESTSPASVSPGKKVTLIPREKIIDIINTMRKQGDTYDQIARYLTDLGQPTFSGRGEWHAQTIHRLCSNT